MNRPYRILRAVRIAVALTVMTVFACMALNVCGLGDMLGRWLANMQIVTALLAGSAGWLLVWLVATLLFGRIYCSVACPLGTLMDIVARLRRPRSYRYRRPATWLRILALVVFVEAGSLGMSALVGWLDPYADFATILKAFVLASGAGWLSAIVVAAVVGVVSWHSGRLLCNTVCPVGVILGAVSRVSLMRFDINPDICTHCGKCEQVCRGSCIDQTHSLIDNSRCVTCFDCAATCPAGAIRWRVGRHRLQWPLLQRVQTTTSAPTALTAPNNQITNPHETISRPAAEDSRHRHS